MRWLDASGPRGEFYEVDSFVSMWNWGNCAGYIAENPLLLLALATNLWISIKWLHDLLPHTCVPWNLQIWFWPSI